ncbi:hypothetical protein D932_03577 [Enterococcus casseliflavus 14-MB-W-14]|nr:hypothetical protein D932_03577 [Enterococcus casseliflavus 14-MB-W-14]
MKKHRSFSDREGAVLMFLFGNWLTNFFADNHPIGKLIQHFSTRIGHLNEDRIFIFPFDDPLVFFAFPCKKDRTVDRHLNTSFEIVEK